MEVRWMEPWGYWIRLNPLPKSYRYPATFSTFGPGPGDNSTFVSCLPTTPNLRYITALVDLLEKKSQQHWYARRGVFVQALARLQLMPALHVKGSVIETVSDEEFGNLILNRIGSR
jgi:hypothetical protein